MSATLQGACYYLDLEGSEKHLLGAMADHANDEGLGVWPGNELLAQKTSKSLRTVQRLLKRLEDAGLIARVAHPAGGRGHAVEWALNAPLIYASARELGWTQQTKRTLGQSPFPSRSPEQPGTKGDTGDTVPDPQRVTPVTQKGDMGDAKGDTGDTKDDMGVTPTIRTVIEPSVEPFPALRAGGDTSIIEHVSDTDPLPATTPRRDLLFEAVAAVCFGADNWQALTSRERGMANRACKDLRAVSATPADVAERAAHFVAWVGQRPTPDNLVTHWNRLREPVQRLHRDDLDAVADAQRMSRIMAEAQAAEAQRAAEAATAATVTTERQLDSGHPPPASPSVTHPRLEGESIRDYIRRINALTRQEVG